MYHNVDRRQRTHYWYFVIVNKLLNYMLLHTVLNTIGGLVYLTMLAKSLITMVVVTLQVVFLHTAIIAELAMCENTVTKYRKVIFGTTLLAINPLVIFYNVLKYLTVIATP